MPGKNKTTDEIRRGRIERLTRIADLPLCDKKTVVLDIGKFWVTVAVRSVLPKLVPCANPRCRRGGTFSPTRSNQEYCCRGCKREAAYVRKEVRFPEGPEEVCGVNGKLRRS